MNPIEAEKCRTSRRYYHLHLTDVSSDVCFVQHVIVFLH